jgi:Patatin-like phospholipase
MEILIQIPGPLQWLIEWVLTIVYHVRGGYRHLETMVLQLVNHGIFSPPPLVVPIICGVFIFWPILLSLLMSLATAWAWIFWLVTSILLGMLQVLYASYQFVMISLDILGLSLLKTYTMIKYYVYMIFDTEPQRQSRTKLWRSQLDACESYEEFLKIRIQPKEVTLVKPIDTALPNHLDSAVAAIATAVSTTNHHTLPHRRANSFTDVFVENSRHALYNRKIPRVRSFPSQVESQSERSASDNDDPTKTRIHHDPSVLVEMGATAADLLVTTTLQLEQARNSRNVSQLKFLLTSIVKRNHLNIDEYLVENSRGIAATGEYGLSSASRTYMRRYVEQVEACLDWLAEEEQQQPQQDTNNNKHKDDELADRYKLVRKMKQNMGRTALMLSGGGAQAMYHLGVIRALIESRQYQDISVISGTSGGSISAAMCAIKTADELLADVCVNTVSTDFGRTGEQAKLGIRWFPTMWDMASYWFKHKLLVDSETFQKTCEFYYKDITFEEAFARTGKHVCITVSASRANGHTAQRLLLNHISTPHVTIASAYVSMNSLFVMVRSCSYLLTHIFDSQCPSQLWTARCYGSCEIDRQKQSRETGTL